MATLTTNVALVNDGQCIQDYNTRNAITLLKSALTSAVLPTIASVNITTIATTQATFLQQTVDDLLNKLRTAGFLT